jgi:hypothetical protein
MRAYTGVRKCPFHNLALASITAVLPMFLKHCFNLLDGLRALLPKNLVDDGGGEHMAGDVPGQSGKGQCGKREEYKGCD